ncbi:GNAT family N-acetyltransferase [Winogradskyella sp.]|nr:GNAT family N-acetyltransferase [Winogradskyella sp.]
MIFIRKATKRDVELLFEWANDSSLRKFSINTGKIVWNDHVQWFLNKMDSNSYILIAETELGIPIGQIRLDKDNDYYLIDFYVANEYRGRGYGKLLLRQGMDYVVNEIQKVVFKAMVNEKNMPSINSFLSVGFILRGEELLNEQKFFCYYKEYKLK